MGLKRWKMVKRLPHGTCFGVLVWLSFVRYWEWSLEMNISAICSGTLHSLFACSHFQCFCYRWIFQRFVLAHCILCLRVLTFNASVIVVLAHFNDLLLHVQDLRSELEDLIPEQQVFVPFFLRGLLFLFVPFANSYIVEKNMFGIFFGCLLCIQTCTLGNI